MKLLNPSDAELNAAFGNTIAGGHWIVSGSVAIETYQDQMFDGTPITINKQIGRFTASADAVLPWLTGNGWAFNVEVEIGHDGNLNVYELMVFSPGDSSSDGLHRTSEAPNWFPRAGVIALLQAHGVEVEFTQ